MPNRWVSKHRGPLGSAHAERRKRSREGNVAILTALSLTLMMAFVALSFDIGNLYHVRTEVQSGVDAAALAGASALNGTSAGKDAAVARAITFGKAHHVYNKNQMPLSASDFEFGHWDFDDKTFTQSADWPTVNAMRAKYTESSVSLPFGSVIGKASTPVRTWATAVGGGPADAECGFPIAVPHCNLGNANVNGVCNYCMQMQDANSDTIGWTGFDQPANKNTIYDAVAAACTDGNGNVTVDPKTGECNGQCIRKDRVENGLQINGGNLVNTGNGSFCELIKSIINRDGTGPNAKPFTITVPVVDAGGTETDCGSAKLNGTKPLLGYTQLDIYAAKCGNSDHNPASATQPPGLTCNPPPSGKYFVGTLHCDKTPTKNHAGGRFFGVYGQPRLVE